MTVGFAETPVLAEGFEPGADAGVDEDDTVAASAFLDLRLLLPGDAVGAVGRRSSAFSFVAVTFRLSSFFEEAEGPCSPFPDAMPSRARPSR